MFLFLSRQFRSLAPIFRPPFDGLMFLVIVYFAWCFLVFPHSQILRGNFPDPDDYMYLTQVLDWLKGQGWYDNIQHRLNPPEGVPIHFSRFAQLPMAILILVFKGMGLGSYGAAILTGLIYPFILLAGLLVAMRWLAQSVMPKRWSGVTAYVTLFATGMMFMFMPGHVDHHGLVVGLIVLTLGCVMRLIDEPEQYRWAFGAGLILALGLTVALETLPWLLLISVGIGMLAVAKGGAEARSGLIFGTTLCLSSAGFLLLTRVPDQLFELDILTYSLVYLLLTGGIALAFIGVGVVAKTNEWIRWVTGVGLALLAGLLFIHRFPELITGPYGAIDPQLAPIILGEVDEAQSLLTLYKGFLNTLIRLGGVIIALIAGLYFLRQAKAKERWKWGFMLAMLVAAIWLTLFYQYRFMATMGMLTIIPLTVFLQRGWQWIGSHYQGRHKFFAEIGLLLLVGPLPSVLFPALVDGRSFNTGILLFPVDSSFTRAPCDTYVLEKILRDPQLYGDHQHLILSSMAQGPELLFRTPHTVLSAPYHMDISGNIDVTRFFSTPYESEAESIARRRHADLVVACRFVPSLYTRAPANVPSPKNATIQGEDVVPHFAELLVTNKAPSWLKRVDFPGLNNYVIYEILPPKIDVQKSRHAK
jgi:hypothetical protein